MVIQKKIRIFSMLLFVVGMVVIGYQNLKNTEKIQNPQGKTQVFVLSYSNFNSLLGPGKFLKQEFEKVCDCTLRIINGGEAGLLLNKMTYLDQVDLVLGLDQFLVNRQAMDQKWLQPIEWEKYKFHSQVLGYAPNEFVPFNWSPLTILSKNKKFEKLEEVGQLKASMSVQNPRTSTTGQHLLWWMYSAWPKEELKKKLEKFIKSIHSVSTTWDKSYGLFLADQVPLTFTYLTSLLYHWVEDSDFSFQNAILNDTHPVQIEYMSIPENCTECELSQKLVEFLLSEKAQEIFMKKNYMIPAIDNSLYGDQHSKIPSLKTLDKNDFFDFLEEYDLVLNYWEEAVRTL